MGTENIILLVLVVVVVAIGLWSTVRHFRGKVSGQVIGHGDDCCVDCLIVSNGAVIAFHLGYGVGVGSGLVEYCC